MSVGVKAVGVKLGSKTSAEVKARSVGMKALASYQDAYCSESWKQDASLGTKLSAEVKAGSPMSIGLKAGSITNKADGAFRHLPSCADRRDEICCGNWSSPEKIYSRQDEAGIMRKELGPR